MGPPKQSECLGGRLPQVSGGQGSRASSPTGCPDVRVISWLPHWRQKLENVRVKTRRLVSLILLACAVGGGMAACGSGGSSSSAPSTSPSTSAAATPAASSSSSSTALAGDEKTIAANWTAFFNPKTPVAKRVSLLQDGSQFASIIQAQAGGGLAASASAQVTKVTVISTTQAGVAYNILLDGQPALTKQSGTAVLQDGTWKVGVTSFCNLLSLENSGNSSKLPAACKSAA